ncbi:MAG TPA: hypothetical protein VKV15_24320 [Bryobacteraceae bacterium]|nr:hypothetical protein [Bryobacteraceae bacterium]
MAGRTEALKEIVLGRYVLGRPDYDPKRHTLVRVEVNAVRRKLAEYYTEAGAEDRVHIDIPLGHYVAVFSPLPAKPPDLRWRRPWYVFVAFVASAIALLSVLAGLWATWRAPSAHAGVPVQVTFDTGWTSLPAVSRDGSVLVYSSDRGLGGNADIWIQQPGKAPRQLTKDPAHDITPDISPDGTQVVFRSWRKEEGIWSISSAGGDAKLVAKGGYSPRFSPDGKWIAFEAMGMDETSHIFTVPANGGLPERLDYGTKEAACPVWSTDGTAVVYEGRSANGGKHDLWIARTRGTSDERSRPLDIQKELRAQNLPMISSNIDCPQDWIEDRLLFVTHQLDTSFLFQVSLGTSGRLGQIRAVPSAIGAEGARAVRGPGGRWSILFATERRQTNIWGYNLAGLAPPEQLTHDDSLTPGYEGTWPALSGDGNILAFITERAGPPDICLKNLGSGAEQLLAAAPSRRSPLFLDHDGSHMVFVRQRRSTASIILRNVAEKTDRLVTTDCPVLHDWSRDGEFLLCADRDDLFRLQISRAGRTPLLHLAHPPTLARFSPNARWISFVTETGQGQTRGFSHRSMDRTAESRSARKGTDCRCTGR